MAPKSFDNWNIKKAIYRNGLQPIKASKILYFFYEQTSVESSDINVLLIQGNPFDRFYGDQFRKNHHIHIMFTRIRASTKF